MRISGELTPDSLLLMRGSACGTALLATWPAAWFDRKPCHAYGPRTKHGAIHFALGMLAGAGAFALMMTALVWSGGASIGLPGSGVGYPVAPAILWVVVFVLVGWSEELIFRGYLFFRLALPRGRSMRRSGLR